MPAYFQTNPFSVRIKVHLKEKQSICTSFTLCPFQTLLFIIMKQKVRLLNISSKQVNIFQIVRNARVYFFWEVHNSNVKTKRNIVISSFCGILRKTQFELPNKLTVTMSKKLSWPLILAPWLHFKHVEKISVGGKKRRPGIRA